MDIQEFNNMAEKIKTEMWAGYKRVKEKWERKEEIDIYLVQYKIESKSFENMTTPTDMISAMNEFMIKIHNLPFHQNQRVAIALSTMNYGYDGGSEVDDNHYECTYNVLGDEVYMTAIIKADIQSKFEILLQPPGKGRRKAASVPCKLMELYLTEVISFSTLQDLVYGDCGI